MSGTGLESLTSDSGPQREKQAVYRRRVAALFQRNGLQHSKTNAVFDGANRGPLGH